MKTKIRARKLVMALALVAGSAACAGPAAAQFRDFFRAPWGGVPSYGPPRSYNPFYPRPQAYEPTRPPPPRKVETPPAETIVVVGDQLADWLAYGLEEVFADTPEIGIVRKIKYNAGLVRYEARPDAPDWAQAIKDILANDKPSAIVVMLGINDRLPLRERPPEKDKDKDKDKKGAANAPPGTAAAPAGEQPASTAPADAEQPATIAAPETQRRSPNGSYEFHGDKWAELYGKRIDEMIAALKGKGVPILWVGLPAVRGTKSTSDMSYLDEIYRAHAEKDGITYIDVWDGFVDERGVFALQGPDFEGQIRRLRTSDGVNFTKSGAEKLARYVEHDLRRLLTSHVVPVALPGPEEQPKGAARPLIGPVLPLNAAASDGGELLGAGGHPAQREPDPLATRVLSHGDPVIAPPGRADDFSWPRADANAATTPDEGAPASPPAPPAKGGAKSQTKDASKNGSKAHPQPAPAAAKPHAALDGAPPRPVSR